jgi:hypothetical protein
MTATETKNLIVMAKKKSNETIYRTPNGERWRLAGEACEGVNKRPLKGFLHDVQIIRVKDGHVRYANAEDLVEESVWVKEHPLRKVKAPVKIRALNTILTKPHKGDMVPCVAPHCNVMLKFNGKYWQHVAAADRHPPQPPSPDVVRQ